MTEAIRFEFGNLEQIALVNSVDDDYGEYLGLSTARFEKSEEPFYCVECGCYIETGENVAIVNFPDDDDDDDYWSIEHAWHPDCLAARKRYVKSRLDRLGIDLRGIPCHG